MHTPHAADNADAVTPSFIRADLFAFLRAVACAPEINGSTMRTLMLLATSGDGTSGANVTIDAAAIAAARGVADRTVWRHLEHLRGTWLEQTSAPTRGNCGRPGRRARYHLCIPESCDAVTPLVDTRPVATSDTSAAPGVTRSSGPSDIGPPDRSHENGYRLTFKPESSDIVQRGNGVRPTSDGPTPSPKPPHASRHSSLIVDLMEEERWSESKARAVVQQAQADPSTRSSAAGRLRVSPDYRRQVGRQVDAAQGTRRADARRCAHGRVDGMTVKGRDASRVCADCEAETPAEHFGAVVSQGRVDDSTLGATPMEPAELDPQRLLDLRLAAGGAR